MESKVNGMTQVDRCNLNAINFSGINQCINVSHVQYYNVNDYGKNECYFSREKEREMVHEIVRLQ